jgi:NAD(P)-dependent dehydrogenase (short-subunit alcohol dehydrogenase family)
VTGSLSGRVAIVTGAGQGMGRAFARVLADDGAFVAVAEVNAETGRQAAEELVGSGRDARFYQVDVRSTEAISAMVEDLVAREGRIDILVNNAGVAAGGPSEEVTEEDWDRVYGIMLTGLFRCSQQVARASMIPRRSGVIVNICSMAGIGGWAQRALYTPAKAGAIALTHVLGVEWARHGIRVVGINPGQVETPLNTWVFERGLADRETFTNRAPMRRFASPEEIARVVRFLVSDEASYITAETITVDGGWIAWGGIEEPVGV